MSLTSMGSVELLLSMSVQMAACSPRHFDTNKIFLRIKQALLRIKVFIGIYEYFDSLILLLATNHVEDSSM